MNQTKQQNRAYTAALNAFLTPTFRLIWIYWYGLKREFIDHQGNRCITRIYKHKEYLIDCKPMKTPKVNVLKKVSKHGRK